MFKKNRTQIASGCFNFSLLKCNVVCIASDFINTHGTFGNKLSKHKEVKM